MIEYDQRVISLSSLLRLLEGIEADLPPVSDTAIFAWHMVDCYVSSLTSQLWSGVNQGRSTCRFTGCSCTIDDLISGKTSCASNAGEPRDFLDKHVPCIEVKKPRLLPFLTSHSMVLQAGDQILESRILHLPMAFDDKWTRECISRYMRSARQEAPYLPSNIDFVAKNNGKAPLAPSCLNQTDTCQCCSSMHTVAGDT